MSRGDHPSALRFLIPWLKMTSMVGPCWAGTRAGQDEMCDNDRWPAARKDGGCRPGWAGAGRVQLGQAGRRKMGKEREKEREEGYWAWPEKMAQ
jgi:hypothetical protein